MGVYIEEHAPVVSNEEVPRRPGGEHAGHAVRQDRDILREAARVHRGLGARGRRHAARLGHHAPDPACTCPSWYGVENTTDEYPLALSGFHYRGRTRIQLVGLHPELKEVNPQEAWINPVDAEPRGIEQGDTVRVKNEFGEIELLAQGHAPRRSGHGGGFPGRVARCRHGGRPRGQGRQHQHAHDPASLARCRRATRSTRTSAKS